MKLKTIEILENRHEPMSVKEIAKILGDSPSHIYRLIHDGEIGGVFRVGWLIRVWPSGVVEFLNKQTAKGSCCQRRLIKPSFGIGRHRKPEPGLAETTNQSLHSGRQSISPSWPLIEINDQRMACNQVKL